MFVHKKCTKLKPKILKTMNPNEWVCSKCKTDETCDPNDINNDIENLNANINLQEIDFDKYDKMLFNPLRYENMTKTNDENILKSSHIDCSYVNIDKLNANVSNSNFDFTLLNLNIRSLNKNLDKLKECLKAVKSKFSIIGLTETQLTDKPADYLKLPGYNLDHVNRVGQNSGGVCLYISNDIKYRIKNELCKANNNYESCFIEIGQTKERNIIVASDI